MRQVTIIYNPEHARALAGHDADENRRILEMRNPERRPIELKKVKQLDEIEKYIRVVKIAIAPSVRDRALSVERDEDRSFGSSVCLSIRDTAKSESSGLRGFLSNAFNWAFTQSEVQKLYINSNHSLDYLELLITSSLNKTSDERDSIQIMGQDDIERVEAAINTFLNTNIPSLDGKAQSIIAEHVDMGVIDFDTAPGIGLGD